MYILGIDQNDLVVKIRKNRISYFILSILAVAVNYIYGFFGHGVTSNAMTWMFLYPLIGGYLVYFILGKIPFQIKSANQFRVFSNAYNAGIAALTTGSLLTGILEIAGTSSPYTIIFYVVGGILLGIGLFALLLRC